MLQREDPDPPVIVVMLQVTVSPVDGFVVVVRVTVVVKPF
jgi:hypothetical protein